MNKILLFAKRAGRDSVTETILPIVIAKTLKVFGVEEVKGEKSGPVFARDILASLAYRQAGRGKVRAHSAVWQQAAREKLLSGAIRRASLLFGADITLIYKYTLIHELQTILSVFVICEFVFHSGIGVMLSDERMRGAIELEPESN